MKLKRLRLKRIFIALIASLRSNFILLISFLVLILLSLSFLKVKNLLSRHQVLPRNLFSFFSSPQKNLLSTGDRTNFLILGIRGEGTADVPDLTDTIILSSYSHSQHQLTLISVPRDLWVDSLKTKINAVYHYGQERQPPSGLQLIDAAILETLGLPVHYNLVIDFQAFTKIVDLLDGIEINVPHAFVDEHFPIPGRENAYPLSSRYQTVEFKQGLQTMDGSTALKYIRSRHAQGEEGTDIARSQRQQLVIKSIQQKIFSTNFLLHRQNRDLLYQIIQQHTSTDVTVDIYPALARLAIDSRHQPLKSLSLSYQPDENGITALDVPPSYLYQNQWVLVAHDNNWNTLKQYLLNRLQGTQ